MKQILSFIFLVMVVNHAAAQTDTLPSTERIQRTVNGKKPDTTKGLTQKRLPKPPAPPPPPPHPVPMLSNADIVKTWGLRYLVPKANGEIVLSETYYITFYSDGKFFLRTAASEPQIRTGPSPRQTNGTYTFSNNHFSMRYYYSPNSQTYVPLEGNMITKDICEGTSSIQSVPNRTFHMSKASGPMIYPSIKMEVQ